MATSAPSKDLCSYCRKRAADITCACGDKFDLNCIVVHVQDIGHEFDYVHSAVGEKLLYVKQMADEYGHGDAQASVENWVRETGRALRCSRLSCLEAQAYAGYQ